MTTSKIVKKKPKPSLEITQFFQTPKILNKNNKSNSNKERDQTPSKSSLTTAKSTSRESLDVVSESDVKKGKRKAIVIDLSSDDSDVEVIESTSITTFNTSRSKASSLPSPKIKKEMMPEPIDQMDTEGDYLQQQSEVAKEVPELNLDEELQIEEEEEGRQREERLATPEELAEEQERIESIANEVQIIAMEVEEIEGGNLRDGRDLDLNDEEEEGNVVEEEDGEFGSDWGDDEGEAVNEDVDAEEEEESEWNGEEEQAAEVEEEEILPREEEEDSQIMKREVLEIADEDESDDDDCMIVQGSSKDLIESPSHSCPLCEKDLSNLSEKVNFPSLLFDVFPSTNPYSFLFPILETYSTRQ